MPRKRKVEEAAVEQPVEEATAPVDAGEETAAGTVAPDDRDSAIPDRFVPPPGTPDEVDDGSIQDLGLSPEQAEAKRLARKPDTSHLEPALHQDPVLGPVPLFNVGDRIVVERHTSLLRGRPWLDTRVLTVLSIDDVTGYVRCRDPEAQQACLIGFLSDTTKVFLCAPAGDPFSNTAKKAAKRAQESAARNAGAGETVATTDADGKKRRGRPKGSKNRPRDVVLAEKKQRQEERAARRGARKQRKAG